MSILSNYTPECIVRASINCKVENFILQKNGNKGIDYAKRLLMLLKLQILNHTGLLLTIRV